MKSMVHIAQFKATAEFRRFFIPVMKCFCRDEQDAMPRESDAFDQGPIHKKYRQVVERGEKMDKLELIKNISFSEAHVLRDLVDYQKGRVVSRTLVQNDALSLTLFAFDQGEGLSTHAAPGDALVQVLDGEVFLTIGGKEVTAKSGEVVVMPADIPHSVNALKPFKMLLTVVKKPKGA